MSAFNQNRKMPIERYIRLIVGSEAITLSLLSYLISQDFIIFLIILGWTALLSFWSNWSPLMAIFWQTTTGGDRMNQSAFRKSMWSHLPAQ